MTHKKDFERWMPGWAVTGSNGRWIVAYKMAAVASDVPGEQILFLKQGPRIWHAFYRERATGSGTTPLASLSGGLGDALSTNAEVRAYCRLVEAAPSELSSQFAGLRAAQSQCYAEAHQS